MFRRLGRLRHRVKTVSVPSRSPLLMRALEPRIVLDAAVDATINQVVDHSTHQHFADEYAKQSVGDIAPPMADAAFRQQEETELTPYPEDDASAQDNPTTLVFIDGRVEDIPTLVEGFEHDVEIIFIEAGVDGVDRIAQTLPLYENVDQVHIISHGSSGELLLGTGVLNAQSMVSRYSAEMGMINLALSETADLLIYGCDFGAGAAGQEATQLLADLTGADVAASTDTTGHASLDGDWDLERHVGSIEAGIAVNLSTQLSWTATLPANTAPTFELGGPVAFTENTLANYANVSDASLADVDGDGDLDVVAASSSTHSIAWIELENGIFVSGAVVPSTVTHPGFAIAADVDGDGDMDLLSSSMLSQTVNWYENDGTESFTERVVGSIVGTSTSSEVVDLDGDGDMDVVSASRDDDRLVWFDNDGSENFTKRTIATTFDRPGSIQAVDMDGDGDLDLLNAGRASGNVVWYENGLR